MSVLHVIYRIDLVSPSETELQGIINHLYPGNPLQFYQILQKDLNELLTNVPGSPLSVVSSGVQIQDNQIKAHIWAQKSEKIITEDIAGLVQTFMIESRLEFAAVKCGDIQRYRVPFRLNFTLQNGFIAVEYPLQFTS